MPEKKQSKTAKKPKESETKKSTTKPKAVKAAPVKEESKKKAAPAKTKAEPKKAVKKVPPKRTPTKKKTTKPLPSKTTPEKIEQGDIGIIETVQPKNPKNALVRFANYSGPIAAQLIGKRVVWTHPDTDKKVFGKISRLHGKSGTLRVTFKHGLPGQAMGTRIYLRK